MKDYKGRNTYSKLGLRKGKPAIKAGKALDSKKKILLWISLFFMVFIVNYLFFMHFKPLKMETVDGLEIMKEVAICRKREILLAHMMRIARPSI